MSKVTLTELFKFSPDGIQVVEYEPGEHELEGRALEVAESMGIINGGEQSAPSGESGMPAAAPVDATDSKATEDAASAAAPPVDAAAKKPSSKK